MYFLPVLGLFVILIIGLSNRRYTFPSKRKRRHSQNSYTTMSIIPRMTRIPLEDDEDLMKLDMSSPFGQINAIALRLEQFDVEENDNELGDN